MADKLDTVSERNSALNRLVELYLFKDDLTVKTNQEVNQAVLSGWKKLATQNYVNFVWNNTEYQNVALLTDERGYIVNESGYMLWAGKANKPWELDLETHVNNYRKSPRQFVERFDENQKLQKAMLSMGWHLTHTLVKEGVFQVSFDYALVGGGYGLPEVRVTTSNVGLGTVVAALLSYVKSHGSVKRKEIFTVIKDSHGPKKEIINICFSETSGVRPKTEDL